MASNDSSVEALRARLSDATIRTTDMNNLLDTTARTTVETTLSALEVAVGAKLFKVALYIHGSYDSAQHDATVTKDLLSQTKEAFDKAARLANISFEDISKIHVKVSEFKSGVVRQLQDDLKSAFDRTSKSMEEQEREVRSLEEEMQSNAERLRDAEAMCQDLEMSESPIMDVGSGILDGLAWLGGQTARVWGDNGYDNSERFAEKLQQARNLLNDLRNEANRCRREIAGATARSVTLRMEYEANSRMQAEMRPLIESIDKLYEKGANMVKVVVEVKSKTVQLARLAADLKQYEEFEISGARKKADFTAGILDICVAALIEPRLADETQMVADELLKGYEGAALSQDNQGKLDQVEQGVKLLLAY